MTGHSAFFLPGSWPRLLIGMQMATWTCSDWILSPRWEETPGWFTKAITCNGTIKPLRWMNQSIPIHGWHDGGLLTGESIYHYLPHGTQVRTLKCNAEPDLSFTLQPSFNNCLSAVLAFLTKISALKAQIVLSLSLGVVLSTFISNMSVLVRLLEVPNKNIICFTIPPAWCSLKYRAFTTRPRHFSRALLKKCPKIAEIAVFWLLGSQTFATAVILLFGADFVKTFAPIDLPSSLSQLPHAKSSI